MQRLRVDCHEVRPLSEGWHAAAAPPDSVQEPGSLDGLVWLPARVPGTAAAALAGAGLWSPHDSRDLDGEDWWFVTRFEAPPAQDGEEVALRLDGVATESEVFLNGARVLRGSSMFDAHVLDVGALLRGTNELAIRCRALAPLLGAPRRPRARWRTRIAAGGLRFHRTTLIGRAPGFAPGPPPVGPWRPVVLVRRRRLAVEELSLRTRVDGRDGVLTVTARLRALAGTPPAAVTVRLAGPSGHREAPLGLESEGPRVVVARGMLRVREPVRWWPHTHGAPALHEVTLVVEDGDGAVHVAGGRVGFRELAFGTSPGHDIEREGIDLHVNGVRVFCRGAVWTPVDPVGFAPEPAAVAASLERVRAAGMNMLRVPGTGCYEDERFHDLCDELGILVWQDFMFANFDYPLADDGFRTTVTAEARAVLDGLGPRPSLAVLCGNSEVEQQAAMLGLDPALGRGELFGELLPALVREASVDAAYVPSAPCGGDLPFRPDRGIANYYGVGGYRRPLEDVRRAGVRFAAECLAFANVPDEEALAADLVHAPEWKAGVPRDVGAGWDFDDVRDHYLRLLFDLDPGELRRLDAGRYLELSRAVTGEVMAEVFGEWRRAGSPCGGGLVLWLRDVVPGAGWGVLDHRGRPKPAYYHLRRALAPAAVWTTDEGLGGVAVHVANDRPDPLTARLRVACYSGLELLVGQAVETLQLPAHGVATRGVEELLGRFVDASWAYRFGPAAQDAIVASLESIDGVLLSQSVRFPGGRPATAAPAAELGFHAVTDGARSVRIRTRRLAYGVRLHVPGFEPDDDAFCVEPGAERLVELRPRAPGEKFARGEVSALNLRGRLPLLDDG